MIRIEYQTQRLSLRFFMLMAVLFFFQVGFGWSAAQAANVTVKDNTARFTRASALVVGGAILEIAKNGKTETSEKARGETLTDSTRSRPCACQRASCVAAVAKTWRSSSITMPVLSHSGMKASGSMSPRSGWRQRTSASAPTMRPLRRSTLGW